MTGTLDGAAGERLCLLGVDAVDLYAREGWTAADILSTSGVDAVEGLILLAQCLMAMMTVQGAATGNPIDPASILPAARRSAGLWRENRP